ncbi:hypothetical protein SBY92_004377 [Candida maltosa Xu316]
MLVRSGLIRSPIFVYSPVRTFKLGKLTEALQSVQQIDKKFEELSKSPTDTKIEQIIKQVEGDSSLLYQLAFFFSKCKRLGITQDNAGNRKKGFLYWPVFLNNLMPLNRAFWDTMRGLNKAEHSHGLNPFKINDIGLLDPKNFPRDFYQQVLTGEYKGLDFKNTISFSFSRPKWEEPPSEKSS